MPMCPVTAPIFNITIELTDLTFSCLWSRPYGFSAIYPLIYLPIKLFVHAG